MSRGRRHPSRRIGFLASCILLAITARVGLAEDCCAAHTQEGVAPGNEVVQEFPAAGPTETAWRVRYGHADGKGLFITGAWFRRTPGDPWMRILWDARVAEIFVPYHPGGPRFYDLDLGFGLVPATSADAGCCGVVLDEFVIKEVRDRGVLWKNDQQVHRGQELVLWATVDAANYNYIIQYGFRDEGSIAFRMAATGPNLPGLETVAHMHDALWRVDVDLAGHPNDSVLLVQHLEEVTSPSASDGVLLFGNGQEGAENWNDLQFTEVRVFDTQRQNAEGRNIAYDLRPIRLGTPRHQESFAHHDFWVTRYRFGEMDYTQLPTYVGNTESISDTDVVFWHISPLHHLPRSEDGRFVGNVWEGVALTMWGGFDMRPRDLFDQTPLYP